MARPKKSTASAEGGAEEKSPDTSTAGSFRRIAQAFKETSVWDNHTIAGFFDDEADFLDPPKDEEQTESTPAE